MKPDINLREEVWEGREGEVEEYSQEGFRKDWIRYFESFQWLVRELADDLTLFLILCRFALRSVMSLRVLILQSILTSFTVDKKGWEFRKNNHF